MTTVDSPTPAARPWLRWVLPPAFLALGGLAMGGLISTRSAAEPSPEAPRALLVQAEALAPAAHRAVVRATGSVAPARQITLAPEVAGRVESVSGHLQPGGRFAAGEELLRLDARDYTAALAAEQSRLRTAEVELELEKGRGEVAQREWQLLQGTDPAQRDLALRVPQRLAAEAAVEAARAAVARAELNVARTRLRAPFPAVVVTESADPGQFLGPGAAVAVLAGTEAAWVTVAVPVDRVSALEIPGVEGHTGPGSAAEVVLSLADGRRVVREGRVIGLGGQLDPATRTAQVLVEVPRPLDPPDGGMPLLFGSFVDVALQGREAPGTVAVARSLLRDGNTVWVAASDDSLQPRRVQVGPGDDRTVLIQGGLEPGDRVVTSPLSLPIAGARVALKGDAAADAAPAADADAAPAADARED